MTKDNTPSRAYWLATCSDPDRYSMVHDTAAGPPLELTKHIKERNALPLISRDPGFPDFSQ